VCVFFFNLGCHLLLQLSLQSEVERLTSDLAATQAQAAEASKQAESEALALKALVEEAVSSAEAKAADTVEATVEAAVKEAVALAEEASGAKHRLEQERAVKVFDEAEEALAVQVANAAHAAAAEASRALAALSAEKEVQVAALKEELAASQAEVGCCCCCCDVAYLRVNFLRLVYRKHSRLLQMYCHSSKSSFLALFLFFLHVPLVFFICCSLICLLSRLSAVCPSFSCKGCFGPRVF
jgi:hypothetical protein